MQWQREKGNNPENASRTQCLWITCFLGAEWPKKTANSPGDRQILINVRGILVMCFASSRFYWTGSQRSKLYYLISSFVPTQCGNSSSWSYFMICGTEMGEIMSAVSLWNSRIEQMMLAAFSQLGNSQGSGGQMENAGKKKKKKKSSYLWDDSPSHGHCAVLYYRPNLGACCIISLTQTEYDS